MRPDKRPLRRRLLPVALITLLSTFSAQLVSWVGGSGDWNTPANWSSGAPPGPDDVVIDRPGEITVTHAFGAHAVKSVLCQEAFTLSGGSLTVSNTIQVNNGFRVSGGALVRATVLQGTNGLGLTATAGTLDGVTLNGDLDLTANGAQVVVTNGLVLNGTAQVGNLISSQRAAMLFHGSQTLGGNGTVVFGFYSDVGANALSVALAGTTLTLEPGLTVRGRNGTIGHAPSWWGGAPNVGVINQATISADTSGGTMIVRANPFTNNGTLRALNGATLNLSGSHSLAGGTLSVGINSRTEFGRISLDGPASSPGESPDAFLIPSGESPLGTGESPVPPCGLAPRLRNSGAFLTRTAALRSDRGGRLCARDRTRRRCR